MQYTALVLAALSAATALPNGRKAHHHHRRHAEADLSDVNWSAALADVDWATVDYDTTTETTTVAIVGAAATTTSSTSTATTTSIAAGNVLEEAAVTTSTSSSSTSSTTAAASATASSSSSSSDDYTIEVVNNCDYTIWQAGWQTNTEGALISSAVKGNEMSAGSTINLSIPKAAYGVEIWARTGCTGSGSSFYCEVGDCQGLECTSIIWQDGPIMAEFGSGLNTDEYNTDITAYDISAIAGNNVGAKIVPSISTCETKYCPESGCDTSQAWLEASDTDLGCPADTTCSNEANFVVTFCPA